MYTVFSSTFGPIIGLVLIAIVAIFKLIISRYICLISINSNNNSDDVSKYLVFARKGSFLAFTKNSGNIIPLGIVLTKEGIMYIRHTTRVGWNTSTTTTMRILTWQNETQETITKEKKEIVVKIVNTCYQETILRESTIPYDKIPIPTKYQKRIRDELIELFLKNWYVTALFTGVSRSGKSTIASLIVQKLQQLGYNVVFILKCDLCCEGTNLGNMVAKCQKTNKKTIVVILLDEIDILFNKITNNDKKQTKTNCISNISGWNCLLDFIINYFIIKYVIIIGTSNENEEYFQNKIESFLPRFSKTYTFENPIKKDENPIKKEKEKVEDVITNGNWHTQQNHCSSSKDEL